MVAAHNKNGANYGPVGQDSRPLSELESSKLLTQRAVFLLLLMMVLLPFVLARLYISHIIILPTAEYTEAPQATTGIHSSLSSADDNSKQEIDTSSSANGNKQQQEEAAAKRHHELCQKFQGDWPPWATGVRPPLL